MFAVLFYILHIFLITGQCREYNGKWIGQFSAYAHKIAGKVYAVDEDTLFIKDFSYDGLGPDAYFWVGKSGDPSPTGVIVPYPDDYTDREPPVLRDFEKEDVILHLPPGYKIKDIAWLSVWCRRFTVNFGDVKIPRNLSPPKRKVLPEFKRLAHGLRSGNITILDSRTFYIPNLHYDGAGPDAYFWVGTGPEPHPGGRKVPNEKGDLENALRGYEGEDIEIRLPQDLTVYDIDWLSVWCVAYKHNFGHVLIPKGIDVPPALHRPQKPKPTKGAFPNCKDLLSKTVQLQWVREGNYVKFKLSGRITEKQWVGLGFSAVSGRTQMVGADAVVVYYTPDQRAKFHADDYYMSAQSQCDGKDGVCPDKRINGKNDIELVDGQRRNGVTTVVFRRPILASESRYDVSLDEETNIFVALGNLNGRMEANYHFGERTPATDDIRLDVNSRNDHNCLAILDDMMVESGPKVRPWPPALIDGVQNFSARIGPTGGKRGYTAITGNPSWGIAWYINDMLIPEIYVERGKTYHFTIEGGDDESNPARYHPFYITDSNEGGFSQKSENEQRKQKIFAGVSYDSAAYPFPTAKGRYCEWEHKTIDKSSSSETFEDYLKTLQLICEDGRPGHLTWTVPLDAPDTLYYQCYTHNNLGWKIHVVNAGHRLRREGSSADVAVASMLIVLSMFLISNLH